MHQNVFVNRALNMKHIKYIGLDMDHTLIRYNTKNFETLVYEFITKDLVENFNYPEIVKSYQFNFKDAIRGLIIDSKNGNILKLSRYANIRLSTHGTRPIRYADQKQFYRSKYIDLHDPNYMVIDTSFSIAFCVLYGQLVDLKDELGDDLPDYQQIAKDVLFSVDKVHADGSLKNTIRNNLEKYVIQDEKIVKDIQRYIAHGKKFFLLTNSDYRYTDILLSYAINPYLPPDTNWSDLFEYVITLSKKPRFFYENFDFLAVDPKTATLSNINGQLTKGIYQGGSSIQFTSVLNVKEDEILYVGDHIYGDILRIKKDCNWRTALIVEELREEIIAQHKAKPVSKKLARLMKIKSKIEQEYVNLYTIQIEEKTIKYAAKVQKLQKKLTIIDKQITELIHIQQKFYNIKWGRLFRTGSEDTFFAGQVERFACVYIEKLSDLLGHSPLTYFRAHIRLLAHDIE